MLWYSLEVHHLGTSNEYLQHMFLWRKERNIKTLWKKKVLYLEQCLRIISPISKLTQR